MSVGLFGYYRRGNFGDDLMAYLMARYLHSIGLAVVIYGSTDLFHDIYGFETEEDLDSFVERVDTVVVGGGGALIPRIGQSSPANDFSSEMGRVIDLCESKGIRIYGISVGGNGLPLHEIHPRSRRRLVESAAFLTLRNPQDLALLASTNTPGAFHHDIVWTTPRYLQSPSSPRPTRWRIGVNLYLSSRSALGLSARAALHAIVRMRRDCEFFFIDVHRHASGVRSATSVSPPHENCSHVRFSELQADIAFIRSLDLVITSKLHLGVVALSFGVPTISMATDERKIDLLYHNVNLQQLRWGSGGWQSLLYYFSSLDRLQRLFASLDGFDVRPIMEDAMGHYRALDRLAQ